jgi:glycosyltransferase involved in cell wall biosynthesis
LIVLGHYGHMGGAERQAFHLIRYLREEKEAKVAVLGWYGTDGPLADILREWGCEIFSFPYKEIAPKLSKAQNLLRLALFMRKHIHPEVILPFVSVNSKPICQIWRLTGARFAWWNQQDEGRGLYGTHAEKNALESASQITSNSWAGTQFIVETYGIPESKILTYNNGTSLPDVANLNPRWRKKLGVGSSSQLVSMLANITPFKDHETLLRAWKLVLEEFAQQSKPLPRLALAGFTKYTSHVNSLKVLAFDLKLGATVDFLGAVDDTDELMFESDLVVHSSVTEGCPNSVCEAMALGRTVVGTDIPGMRQALDQNLWPNCLSESHNAERLAKNIIRFLTDGSLAEQVGVMNRRRIEEDFSVDGMCETLIENVSMHAS